MDANTLLKPLSEDAPLLVPIIKALGFREDATLFLRDVLDRIRDLREDAGEDVDEERPLSPAELLAAGQHESATLNPDGTITISLYFPIMSGTEKISELVVTRPKMHMMKRVEASKGGDLDKSIRIFSELTGKAPAELAELDMADVDTLNLAFSFLSKPPRRTGTKS